MKWILSLLTLSLSLSAFAQIDDAACLASKRAITTDMREVHGSTIVETPTGIVAAWFAGGEHQPTATIESSVWDGRMWSKPVIIADGQAATGPRQPVWNPVLFINDKNELELTYKVGPLPSSWWGQRKISTDFGKTWGPAQNISSDMSILGPVRAKPTKLLSGDWLAGASTETPATPSVWKIHLERRILDQTDWSMDSAFAGDKGNYGVIQPIFLQWPNGDVQVMARSNRLRIIEAWSKDGGKTFGPLKESSLKNPNSGFDAVTIKKTGEAVLVYNSLDTGRGTLSIAKSTDGITWKNVCNLENNFPFLEYSYPAIIEAANGEIHVTYTDNRRWIQHSILKF